MHILFITLVLAIGVWAETPNQVAPAGAAARERIGAPSRAEDSRYILGPDDQLAIWGIDLEEISGRPIHIDAKGDMKTPLIGRVHAAGLTIPELEQELAKRLRVYVNDPQIVVTLSEYRSQPASVLGAVNTPGSHQLKGRKTVAEVLALAGGLKPEAGTWVKLTRRDDQGDIPHPSATKDTDGGFSYVTLNLSSITDAKNQTDNIVVRPFDILTVPRADVVYVIGDVHKAGEFVLNERQSMSVLQALSMAGGLTPTAAGGNAKILRAQGPVPNSSAAPRTEISVNIGKLMAGKIPDVQMTSEDILVVPSSTMKKVTTRSVEAAIQALTGMVIWGAN